MVCLFTQVGCLVFMVDCLRQPFEESHSLVKRRIPNYMSTHACYGLVIERLQEMDRERLRRHDEDS